MKITIRTDRNSIILEVAVTDRVEQLKEKISDKLNCRIDQQQLYYKNEILHDPKYLLDYSLGEECELYLEIKMSIIVKMCTTQIELDCYPSMSIHEVKHEISRKIPIQPNSQVLTYEERELRNIQTVRDCKLKDRATIILTGAIDVSVTFPSGKNASILFEQSSYVFAIKDEVQKKDYIPGDHLTLNYKGRVLREDQTFASIHYREGESISLVVQQLEEDKINIFVLKPNGERHLISINRFDPIGKIEGSVFSDVDSLFSHFCFFNNKKLDDIDVLSTHRIQSMSEVELRSCDNKISVFVSLLNGSVTSFYLQPTELVSEVKSRIKSKLGTDNSHKNLFHKHKKLANDQTMRECEVLFGAYLLFGGDDSFSVTIHPGYKSFDILAQRKDRIKDLKIRIQNRESIPSEFQEISFEGGKLENHHYLKDLTLQCGSIFSMTIPSEFNPISLKLRDLAGNSTYINQVSVFTTVKNFTNKLAPNISISKHDILVFQNVIMEPAKLLCSYGITSDSEVQIVSINNPNILGHIATANTQHGSATQTNVPQGYAQSRKSAEFSDFSNQPRQFESHPKFSQSASHPPHQQTHPSNQPIQNPHQPIHPPNQPIQNPHQQTHTPNQPIQNPHQQTHPSNQPIQNPQQPIHPSNQPIQNPQQQTHPSNQPIQNPHQHQPTNIYNQPTHSLPAYYQQIPPPTQPTYQGYTFTTEPTPHTQYSHNPQQTHGYPQPTHPQTFNPQHTQPPDLDSSYRQTEQQYPVSEDYVSGPVGGATASLPPHPNIREPHIGRQQSGPVIGEPKEMLLDVKHSAAGTVQIKCFSNQSIGSLKESISRQIPMPLSKIKLLYDDILLSDERMTLGEYGICYERIIKMIDLLCISINCDPRHFVKWMNGSDLVSSLATEVAKEMSVRQETVRQNVRLIYAGLEMDFGERLSSYSQKGSYEVRAEII